jgi:hypothetical protein
MHRRARSKGQAAAAGSEANIEGEVEVITYMSSCEAVPPYAPLHLLVSAHALAGTADGNRQGIETFLSKKNALDEGSLRERIRQLNELIDWLRSQPDEMALVAMYPVEDPLSDLRGGSETPNTTLADQQHSQN